MSLRDFRVGLILLAMTGRKEVNVSTELSYFAVFLAGAASFLSPCVVPLMPVYLSYLTGSSLEDIEQNPTKLRKMILIQSAGFLVGLLIVFSLLGLTATAIGQFLALNSLMFKRVSGVILIVFGLFHGGFLKISWLSRERKFRVRSGKPRLLNSILIGMVFSFGWTPCIGTVLGSILVVAANSLTIMEGLKLLVIYSAGFSIPFLITAVFLTEILKKLENSGRFFDIIKKATGVLIALTGVLILANWLDRLLLVF